MQFLRPGDEAMVRHGPDQRRRRLNRIEPAHLLGAARIAARGKVASEAQMSRRRAQKVAVDRENHVGGGQVRHALDRRPYASAAPCRTLSRETGSHWCQRAAG